MTTTESIQAFLNAILSTLPAPLQGFKEELSQHVHQQLQILLSQCELVPRDEFDAQMRVLARTRARMEALEEKLRQHTGKQASVPITDTEG